MTISVTTPVTGSAQTGFSSPSFVVASDAAPNAYSKQYAVTSLTGAGSADPHGASKPFTLTFSRPQSVRSAPVPNPTTGVMGNSPRNTYSVLVRKGTVPGTNQNPQTMVLRCDLAVVAGADLVEPDDVRAGLSLLIGGLSQQSAGIGDMLINNLL